MPEIDESEQPERGGAEEVVEPAHEETENPLPEFGDQRLPGLTLEIDLTSSQAHRITARRRTSVILLAGAPESGKTTLLTSLYDVFQRGSSYGFHFGGSYTLHGFELRCHLSRITSGQAEADTDRTRAESDFKYLHLSLQDTEEECQQHDILLSDIPGEIFEAAQNSTEACERLDVMHRADRLAILLDSHAIAEPRRRHEAIQQGKSLLRSLLDGGMLPHNLPVDIIFTKYDRIESHAAPAPLEQLLDEIKQEYNDLFAERIDQLSYFKVAARPSEGSDLPFGFGLEQIFRPWVKSQRRWGVAGCKPIPILTTREYERYAHLARDSKVEE